MCRFKTCLLNLASRRLNDQLKKRQRSAGFAAGGADNRPRAGEEDSSRMEELGRIPDPARWT